jgi:hypothetical protein
MGKFWDGISSVPDETIILLWLGCHCLVCGNMVYYEMVLLLGRRGYTIKHYYPSMKLKFSQHIWKDPQIIFIKIRTVGHEFFNADGRTDRHIEFNNRFSRFVTAPEISKLVL